MAVIQIHGQLEILHVSCRLELSPSDFDFYFRWGLVENRKARSNSLTNTRIFFSCTSRVEIAISRCFQDRILRRVTRTSGPCCSADKSVLFWLRYVKLYYHANQIRHVCNNLLDDVTSALW